MATAARAAVSAFTAATTRAALFDSRSTVAVPFSAAHTPLAACFAYPAHAAVPAITGNQLDIVEGDRCIDSDQRDAGAPAMSAGAPSTPAAPATA
ncbi:hypothetical protein [Sorangium sp. So ce124]|uniref:hypothetical protein n=1 Tax=Sorangium sp. So ce124 TaxID=3133280 RepID=UPI003F5D7764